MSDPAAGGVTTGAPWRLPLGEHRPRVTVLGGTGFLGGAVTDELLRREVTVRVVGRRAAPHPVSHPNLQVRIADLADPRAVVTAVTGSDAVVVLTAFRSPTAQWRVSDTDPMAERMTVGVIRDVVDTLAVQCRSPGGNAASPPMVLMAGSAPANDLAAVAADPYARLKARAEDVLRTASATGAISGACLRLPTVYGRIECAATVVDRGVITAMARRALAGEPLTIWHQVRRNLLHVRDAASAFAAALDHGDRLSAGCWAVGGDRPVPLTDLFAQIARIAADRRGTLPVPVQPSAPPAHASPLDAADVSVDSTPFRSITGWRPVVPDDDGLLDLITALADEADGTAQHHHGGSARSESHPTAEHLEAAS